MLWLQHTSHAPESWNLNLYSHVWIFWLTCLDFIINDEKSNEGAAFFHRDATGRMSKYWQLKYTIKGSFLKDITACACVCACMVDSSIIIKQHTKLSSNPPISNVTVQLSASTIYCGLTNTREERCEIAPPCEHTSQACTCTLECEAKSKGC